MNENLFIKNSRQKRAVQELLSRACVQVKDMGPLIGALNPRQMIMELRHQGFQDIILTRRFSVPDRDGKGCQPGEYYIPPELKHLAREALIKYTAIESTNSKAAAHKANDFNRGV